MGIDACFIIKRPSYNKNMGTIEKRVQKRIRKQNLRAALLTAIAAVGVITLAMAAPKTLTLLKYVPGMRAQYVSRIKQSLRRLVQRGYVQEKLISGRRCAELTESGKVLLARLSIGSSFYVAPKKWDRRWRIVIFDIPEHKRGQRARVRLLLIAMGFHCLQGSVWIFPYDCEDIITLLKADFRLGQELLYVVAEEVEGDYVLRQRFNLLQR